MSAKTSVSEEPAVSLEDEIFGMLTRIYVQQADNRHKAKSLQYMTAETHDLAKTMARFFESRRSESENRIATLEIQASRLRDERDTARDELMSCQSELFHCQTA
jgi:4-alpha-glucanotransferase